MSQNPSPPLLIAAALAFWGWHSGLWWVALPLALLAELPRITSWRFALAPRERQRVADLCTLLIALVGVWLALREPHLGRALIVLIQWLPVLMFPLLAVQLYDGRQGLELSVLFLSLRGEGKPAGATILDLRWGYLALCVIAASMRAPEAPWFLPSLVLLAGYALWPRGGADGATATPAPVIRRRLAALGLAALLGFGIAAGLRLAHSEAEHWIMRWVEHWLGTAEDPYRATTAIGQMGQIKGSDRLRMRVYPEQPAAAPPPLLATASYDRYIDHTWFTSGIPFEPVPRDGDVHRLRVTDASAEPAPERTAAPVAIGGPQTRILLALDRPEGLLPLPADAVQVSGLTQTELQRNGLGATRFRHEGSPRLAYRVAQASPGNVVAPSTQLAPPDATDGRVPLPEQPGVERFIERAGLAGLPPEAALARLSGLLQQDFRYTLELPAVPANRSPIDHFLNHARAGHCEYFATAAALVLRGLGIPARYTRGWSVQEYSPLEGAWIVRDRDAHAWVQVHLDGAWQAFDPTPPDWHALETAGRPWTVALTDRIAWLRFVITGGAAEQPQDRTWLLLPLGLLVLLLAWRIARRGRRRAATSAPATNRGREPTHPFTALERTLDHRSLGRRNGETLRDWAQRLEQAGEPVAGPLLTAVDLYYRQRFDPLGLDQTARAHLADALQAIVAAGQAQRRG